MLRYAIISYTEARGTKSSVAHTVTLGILIVSVSVLLAVAGLVIVQRRMPLEEREAHNAAIGIVYAAFYVMFGMMVGFSAFLVLSKYISSQGIVESEAGSVEELYWLAENLPEPEQTRIQDLTISYARTMIDEEWPMMEQGQTSPRAAALADELRRSIQSFESDTNAEQALYAQGLERIHDLDEDREVRILHVREGIPPILWVVLISLGINTVLFTYFVGMKSPRLHILAVAALAGAIALILFTIGVLDHPFGPGWRVDPDAFELVLNTIEGNNQQETG